MREDAIKYVQDCGVCQRNARFQPMHHPALSSKVNAVFDRIGIDLVLGMESPSHLYIGCLCIIEFVTQYPWVYPIKSKSAEENAGGSILRGPQL